MVILENITKQYDSNGTGVHSVSLHVEKGSFVSVIGPSGAGKSTLLRCINGMLQVTEGKILVDGRCISAAKGRQKREIQRKIGMIFQNFCLVNETTALENVLNARLYEYPFWRMMTGCFPDEACREGMECLDKVGLLDKAGQRAALLSGGEQQRTAIARALMQHCSLLLADEPVASLDPVNADAILALLKKMQQEQGMTIIMNSHNVTQAAEVSDRVIGLREGKILFDGSPKELDGDVLDAIYGKEPVT
ncbi:MAG: phosphonate ABC transporter ATP-binding protein [Coprococcus sp.]